MYVPHVSTSAKINQKSSLKNLTKGHWKKNLRQRSLLPNFCNYQNMFFFFRIKTATKSLRSGAVDTSPNTTTDWVYQPVRFSDWRTDRPQNLWNYAPVFIKILYSEIRSLQNWKYGGEFNWGTCWCNRCCTPMGRPRNFVCPVSFDYSTGLCYIPIIFIKPI